MKKKIPNPSQISITREEQAFVQGASTQAPPSAARKAKPRNISVYDDFWEEVNEFLKEFPAEGNRSSFIARVVSDYIMRRRSELKKLQS
mgnify:CR=1 FL=1